MSDEKPKTGPDYIPTKQIPRVEVPNSTLNAMLTEMRSMHSDVKSMETDVSALVYQGKQMTEWRADMEQWRADINSAIVRNSTRARLPSEHDIAAAAELAKERAARQDLDKKVDGLAANDALQNSEIAELKTMLTDVKRAVVGTINNPKVRFVGKTMFGIAMAYAAAKGIRLVP